MKFRLALLLALLPSLAFAQQGGVLQSGLVTPKHPAMWIFNNTIGDAGGAGNGLLSELGITNTGTPFCINDAPITAPGGYHQLCLGANANNKGTLSYSGSPGTQQLPFQICANGTCQDFPFSSAGGAVAGPHTSVVGDIATWANTTGTLLADSGATTSEIACPSILLFGGKPDGVSDNSAAFAAAVGAHAAAPCVFFPGGTYAFSNQLVYSFPASNVSLTIQGAGAGVSRLLFPNAGGIVINYSDISNSVNISGLNCLNSKNAGGDACLTLNRLTSDTPLSLQSAPSTIQDVVIGPASAGNDWATCIAVNGVSIVNYSRITCNNTPVSGYGGTVNGLVITGTFANPSIVHNISASNFNYGNDGIVLNRRVEGVVVCCGTNFTGGNTGIHITVPGQYDQLTVTGSQFNNTIGMSLETYFNNTKVQGNLFIIPTGGFGVFGSFVFYLDVVGNGFDAVTQNQGTGVWINHTNSVNDGTLPGAAQPAPRQLIAENSFVSLASGIHLTGNSADVLIPGNNIYSQNVVNLLDDYPDDQFNIIGASIQTNMRPTLGSDCGSPGLFGNSSNDARGNVIMGTGVTATCTMTFHTPYTAVPFCFGAQETVSSPATRVTVLSTTQLTFTADTGTFHPNDRVTYACNGYQ